MKIYCKCGKNALAGAKIKMRMIEHRGFDMAREDFHATCYYECPACKTVVTVVIE